MGGDGYGGGDFSRFPPPPLKNPMPTPSLHLKSRWPPDLVSARTRKWLTVNSLQLDHHDIFTQRMPSGNCKRVVTLMPGIMGRRLEETFVLRWVPATVRLPNQERISPSCQGYHPKFYSGFVLVIEHLKSHGIWEFNFPGPERNGIYFLVLESHGKLRLCLMDYIVTEDVKARKIYDGGE